ncbi:cobyric acid synthase CobQ [Sutcliffiella horikoshii]|uniref:Cobyric acid synthase n=1 Tax=Sutcliffiella horikoshii TaxID=79883 RepID=A0A1Y0CMV2_9BACI|nr:cobyric acid synthase [Sutcliffiella horikoshii]ART76638.1 cobyric acid synthase CobQ [Sutcliffiella horikoshii]TYS57999.1 cobyric acid synthase [Sutcliffiella horikoshii]
MFKGTPLMIQGTHSDAGKSALVTALCRIFAREGYKTAPFKSQNMALNSYITRDGKEIGRAQGVQAEAAGVVATTDMNPILIKPTGEYQSQIVVHGKPFQNMKAGEYRQEFYEKGLQVITESYLRLQKEYEILVIEGAGSPAEVNLNDRELVNMRIARLTNAPVILVGDIEKGGVFASLVGTLQLLEEEDRKRVIGVVINKFRGDVSLLEPGLEWFEAYTGIPVLGVIPYVTGLHIEAEDSVVLDSFSKDKDETKDLDIAVIRFPYISNFTDMDPLFSEEDCHVKYVQKAEELGEPDLVILPGSKNTLGDLQFLHESGLGNRLQTLAAQGTRIFGICGGYQMLGEEVVDEYEIESSLKVISGLGLIPMTTHLEKEKRTVLSEGILNFKGKQFFIKGYEIHMGVTTLHGRENVMPFAVLADRTDGVQVENIIGTYFHGIFHNDSFREELLNTLRQKKGLSPLIGRTSFDRKREESFDRLADVVSLHLSMDKIKEKMVEFERTNKKEVVQTHGKSV